MKHILLIASMTLGLTLLVFDKPASAGIGEAVSIGKSVHARDVPPLPQRKPARLLPPLPEKKPDMNELERRRAIIKNLEEMKNKYKFAKKMSNPVNLLILMMNISLTLQMSGDDA